MFLFYMYYILCLSGKERHMTNESNTAYDDVFRTTVNDCPKLILPVFNELFRTGFTGNEIIVKMENEIFIHKQDGKEEKRITDTSIVIKKNPEDKGKGYHLECQSTKDGSMAIRMYEYDSQIALKNGEMEDGMLTVRFPESAILYLRSDKKTPKFIWMKMETPGGNIQYQIPVMKIKDYTLDMIFEKHLYFILPFYIFTYEKVLRVYERNKGKLRQLQEEFLEIRNQLQRCNEDEVIDEYTKCTLFDMSKKVVRSLLGSRYPKVRKGVEEAMGGNILEYEAKTILNKGKMQGRLEGENLFAKLVSNLFADGRANDAELAAKDENIRKQFYREYGMIE